MDPSINKNKKKYFHGKLKGDLRNDYEGSVPHNDNVPLSLSMDLLQVVIEFFLSMPIFKIKLNFSL